MCRIPNDEKFWQTKNWHGPGIQYTIALWEKKLWESVDRRMKYFRDMGDGAMVKNSAWGKILIPNRNLERMRY